MSTERTRPNVVECIGYCYGRALPASMHDWVRNDTEFVTAQLHVSC